MDILRGENLFMEFNQYGNITKALNGISLSITEGKFLSIMGQSGSGKSTLLYVLCGLERPTAGKVFYGEEDLNNLNDGKLSKLRRKEFGFIFQYYNLIPTLTVEENIVLPLELDGVAKRKYEENLTYILEKIGMKDKRRNYSYQLSGGEQQRVAIARALITDPKVIFADEPTGNLDSVNGTEILKLLSSLCRENNRTILMVTHDNYAASFSDLIIKIKDGSIIEQ